MGYCSGALIGPKAAILLLRKRQGIKGEAPANRPGLLSPVTGREHRQGEPHEITALDRGFREYWRGGFLRNRAAGVGRSIMVVLAECRLLQSGHL